MPTRKRAKKARKADGAMPQVDRKRYAVRIDADGGRTLVRRSPQLRLWGECIVDNFAGGGGATVGIEEALGRSADVAINHDPAAIALHQANHPETHHYVEDVWNVDPREASRGRPVGLAWFSPDCTHFSRAKGAKPVKQEIRGLAWVVIRWARAVAPRVIILENVPEFTTWGPLAAGRPCPERRGQTFQRWLRHLRKLGYHVEWRELTASDYGAPTKRTRLFIIARRDGRPIEWPGETHGNGLTPYRTAGEIIDWDLPCRSIFDPTRRPLAPKTLQRIADGLRRYVIEAEQPFIVRHGHYFKGKETTFRGQPLTRPLGVVCATNDKNLVLPYLRRPGSTGPASTAPLVAAFIAKHYGGVVGHGMRRPLGTVTARDHHSLVSAFLVKYYGSPLGQHQPLTAPLHTIRTRDTFGLVTVAGEPYQIADIGMRMLAPRELFDAQGFPSDYRIDPDYQGKPLTKTNQIRMAGNSVCPDVSRALVRANYAEAA